MMCDSDYCRTYDLLREAGELGVKQRCATLFKQGYTREQVNVILNEDLLPEFNNWIAAQCAYILRGFTHESHTLN
jgi:hypothetical protein